jgi:hypothetical protein
MSNREQNEKRFKHWEDMPGGGRRYWYDVSGRQGYWARYVKIVDGGETTTAFFQEIYSGEGKLVAVHEKFPEDRGHRQLEVGEDDYPTSGSE